ncbi:ABC transporter substrate-binding protein [Arenibaculum pallidiluteum]|uniref:ABC transporter substrate-binding protein n=1 Tax=Arenibaculum pallidiluteum TaxID=2812559 RepID=UPI001A95E47B|nr:ABC transporter substrate-binding protein [Arenibaculum pallidiluteum]
MNPRTRQFYGALGVGRRAVLALALGLGALSALPAPASAQGEKVTVAVLPLSSSAPIFIAHKRGYFSQEGLNAELRSFSAAQQVPVAVTSGDADFGITGLTAGFYNLAAKGTVKIVAAQSREEPGYQLSAYLATKAAYDAGFTTPAQFKGKRVATTTAGSTFHYMFGLLAEKYGFSTKDIQMVPLQDVPKMVAAFKGGQVEGMIAPVTVARQLEAEGSARILGWVGDVTPWQLGALFTSPETIRTRRATVEKFVRAYQRGAADYNNAFNVKDTTGQPGKGPGYDELLAIIAEATKQKPELVAVSLPFIDPQGRLLVDDVVRQTKFWQAEGQVDKALDPLSTVDLSFVNGHLLTQK